MNFVYDPNLPEREVKLAVIDVKARKFHDELTGMGISLIFTKKCNNIDHKIATHPDMQICHTGDNVFLAFEEVCGYYQEKIEAFLRANDCEKINKRVKVTTYPNCTGELLYPEDCRMNSVVTSNWIITHTSNCLFDEFDSKIIKVRQGYTKCSTCLVSDNAIITADRSIEKSAVMQGIDVCLVTNDTIELAGYPNGFIGGCCGKISKDKMVFFGDVKTHPDQKKIISFCSEYNVECISLGKGNLQDYGSLLPIIEE